jgi:peptidylprolyl isomerase
LIYDYYMGILDLIRNKFAYPSALASAALLLSACGGGGRPSAATTDSTEAAASPGPPIKLPSRPPPRHVVIKDLVVGKGIPIQPALPAPSNKPVSFFTARYKSADYKTGKVVFDTWGRKPEPFTLGPGGVVPGWEVGVVGMKAGGRRELIVPSRLAYGEGAVLYVVEVLTVKKVD